LGAKGRHQQSQQDRLHRGLGSAFLVMLPGAAGDHCGRAHAQADGERHHDHQHAFRDADGRRGVRAKMGHKKDVHDAEQRLHGHLQDHRHGQQDDCAVKRDGGKVLPRAKYGFFDQGKQIRNSGLRGFLYKGTQASLHRALPARKQAAENRLQVGSHKPAGMPVKNERANLARDAHGG
jgi:hypothetical protein